jgi:TatA/E family protein of Tat protein translocase
MVEYKASVDSNSEEEAMGQFSIYHWLVVLLVILLLFGGRKIPELMKGMGEGIRSFKEGIAGKSQGGPPPPQVTDRVEPRRDSSNQKS